MKDNYPINHRKRYTTKQFEEFARIARICSRRCEIYDFVPLLTSKYARTICAIRKQLEVAWRRTSSS